MQGKHWPPANYCAGKHIIYFCPLGWSHMSINTDHAVHGLHLNLEQTHKITSKLLSNRSKWKHMNSPRHCLSSKIFIWSNKRHSVVLDDQWTAKKEWRIIPSTSFSMDLSLDCGQKFWKCININVACQLHSRPVCSLSGLRTDTSVIYLFKGTHSSFIVRYSGFSISTQMDVIRVGFPVSHTSHSKIDL